VAILLARAIPPCSALPGVKKVQVKIENDQPDNRKSNLERNPCILVNKKEKEETKQNKQRSREKKIIQYVPLLMLLVNMLIPSAAINQCPTICN